MIKEPITNVVGLKALAWDYSQATFVSPARPEFVWSRGGLQASVCGRGQKHEVPDEHCTCGLYAAYELDIINNYTDTSPVSPIFLVEASGKTIIHEDGWRSAEMTIHLVANPFPNDGRMRLICGQAADYFQIPVVDMSTLLIAQDLYNCHLLPYYRPRSATFRGMSNSDIQKIFKDQFHG